MQGASNGNQRPPTPQNGDVTISLPGRGQYSMVLPVGLEGLSLDLPHRLTTTQALEGFWFDSLGRGIGTLTISGNTGYRSATRVDGQDGVWMMKEMIALHRAHMDAMAAAPKDPNSHLILHDGTFGVAYELVAQDFKPTRDKSSPLLFRWEWSLTIVKTMGDHTGLTPTAGRQAGDEKVANGTPNLSPSAQEQQQSLSGLSNQARVALRSVAGRPPSPVSAPSNTDLPTLVSNFYGLFYTQAGGTNVAGTGLSSQDQVAAISEKVKSFPLNSIADPTNIPAGTVVYMPPLADVIS